MNVQEFIEESLFEIASAVQSINRRFNNETVDATANPDGAKLRMRGGGYTLTSISDTQMVEFDIAVTVDQAEERTSGAKGSLQVAIVSVGGGKSDSTQSKQSTVSRLSFTIPLKLPTGEAR